MRGRFLAYTIKILMTGLKPDFIVSILDPKKKKSIFKPQD